MESQSKEIRLYITADGKIPFAQWLESISDLKTQAIIDQAQDKIRCGLLTNCKPVGSGVSESKIDYEAGYRIYFGQIDFLVVLLWGGRKKNEKAQNKDIQKAKEYWADYEEREGSNK